MVLDIDESATPTIKKTQSNALWAAASDFMYSMTSAGSIGIDNITKHAITGKTSGTYTLKATHKVTKRTKTFTVKVNKNAIIILPGFMGSTLVLNSNYLTYSKGDVFWDTSLTELDKADALVRIESLRCLLDGSSLVDLVVEQDNYGAGNYYQSLYKSLKDEYGENYEVSFFAYDWRMSNKVSAQDLNEYITENAYDKVVLVAHSMGGLVASSYLAIGETQQNKVQKLITLGSPLLGTPIAPYVWGSERVDVLLGGALGDVTLSWSELLLYVFAQQKT